MSLTKHVIVQTNSVINVVPSQALTLRGVISQKNKDLHETLNTAAMQNHLNPSPTVASATNYVSNRYYYLSIWGPNNS